MYHKKIVINIFMDKIFSNRKRLFFTKVKQNFDSLLSIHQAHPSHQDDDYFMVVIVKKKLRYVINI